MFSTELNNKTERLQYKNPNRINKQKLWNELHANVELMINKMNAIHDIDMDTNHLSSLNHHSDNDNYNELQYYKKLVAVLGQELDSLKLQHSELKNTINTMKHEEKNKKTSLETSHKAVQTMPFHIEILKQNSNQSQTNYTSYTPSNNVIKTKNLKQQNRYHLLSNKRNQNHYDTTQQKQTPTKTKPKTTTTTTISESKQNNTTNNNDIKHIVSNQQKSLQSKINETEKCLKKLESKHETLMKQMQNNKEDDDESKTNSINMSSNIPSQSPTNTSSVEENYFNYQFSYDLEPYNVTNKDEYIMTEEEDDDDDNNNKDYIHTLCKLQQELNETQNKLSDVQKLNTNLKLRLSKNLL